MWEWIKQLPTWGKALSSVVAGIIAITTIWGWTSGFFGNLFTTENEIQEVITHHDADVQSIAQSISESERKTRLRVNQSELFKLQQQLIGQKYSNEGEKEFITSEIARLGREIRCDQERDCG